jgi:hypothetical protein
MEDEAAALMVGYIGIEAKRSRARIMLPIHIATWSISHFNSSHVVDKCVMKLTCLHSFRLKLHELWQQKLTKVVNFGRTIEESQTK